MSTRQIPSSVLQLCFAFVCLFWLGALAILADTHYVRSPDTCTNTDLQSPYTSWDTAATNIQWAVNAASGGETVWVSNGTYCLTNQIEIANNITVQSTNGYSNTLVYAGWPTYVTRCFYVTRTGVVDGFTVSNGHYVSAGTNGGGGAYLATGTIQNCYFANNVVTNTANMYSGGGGIYVNGAGMISNCTFVSNSVLSTSADAWGPYVGGGAVMLSVYGYVGPAYVLDSRITSNNVSVTGEGGGIYVGAQTGPVISNCVISFNSSGTTVQGDGGGVFMYGASLLVDCVIRGNRAPISASGVWVVSGGMVKNCLIADNVSTNSSGSCGAALFLRQGSLVSNCVISGNMYGGGAAMRTVSGVGGTLDRCVISNNLNTSQYIAYGDEAAPGAGGVGIRNGGFLRNCLISNNSNTYVGVPAGGVYMTNSGAGITQINCTVVNNYSANTGGGVSMRGPSNYVVNCVIASNTAPSGSDVYCYDSFDTNYFYSSCVNTNLAPNQGNITNDPRFAGANAGNWRLANNSPCMNTGTNQNWMTNSFDLDGRTRIRYGRVDMGAYEKINEATIYNFQ